MTPRKLLASIITFSLLSIAALGMGCSGTQTASPQTEIDAAGNTVTRGSGSIGAWRNRPGQRTFFDRAFRIPTTISVTADRGSWNGEVTIINVFTNQTLCRQTISGGSRVNCTGILGDFRLTISNDSESRDLSTGEIRFNN